MNEIRRAATVRGRVQGVSFRWYTREQADRLGVSGWVRNDPDGAVRLEVQGAPDAVESLLRWAHHGPGHAQVSSVEVTDRAVSADEDGFRIER